MGVTSVSIGATFINLADKLSLANPNFNLNVGRADQDNQAKGVFQYLDTNNFKVTTTLPNGQKLTASGNPAEVDLYATNPTVNLFGAETRVPIEVELSGEKKTFYAVVRKNSLDQWLDFIRVDGKDLALNRHLSTDRFNGMMEASTVVYNTNRSAVIQIQASESTSNINMSRERYILYVRDEKGNLVASGIQDDDGAYLSYNYNPAGENDPLSSTHATGLLSLSANSLNDGENHFFITVTPVSGSYPARDYLLTINFVNLDIYLDSFMVFDVAPKVLEQYPDGNYLKFIDRTYNPHIYDYRFNYELQPDGSGKLRVEASAATSYDLLTQYAQTYYPDHYKGQVYSEYEYRLTTILQNCGEFAGHLGDNNWFHDQVAHILAGEYDQLADEVLQSQAYNVTYAESLKNTNYHGEDGLLATRADELTQAALEQEIIWVTIGQPDELVYKIYNTPNNTSATPVATVTKGSLLPTDGVKASDGTWTATVKYNDELGLVRTITYGSYATRKEAADAAAAMVVPEPGYVGHERDTVREMDVDLEVYVTTKTGSLVLHRTDIDWQRRGGVEYDDQNRVTRIYRTDKTVVEIPYDDVAPADAVEYQDYMKIPVTLYVPRTDFTLTYSATYHVLSHDATLKPDGKWGVDMGVQGYVPNEVEKGSNNYVYTYLYNMSHEVSQAYIWANINHDHDNTEATLTLKQSVNGGKTKTVIGNITKLLQLVDLEVGINDFEIEVTSELGDKQSYLIRIVRAGADLDLEFLRVNGMNAILDTSTGSYFAYVPLGAKDTVVTAQATDHKRGVTDIWNTVTGSKGSSPKAGEMATLSNVWLHNDLEKPTRLQVKISVTLTTTTVRPKDSGLTEGVFPATWSSNYSPTNIHNGDAQGYTDENQGDVDCVQVTVVKNADGTFNVTTTRTQYRIYELNLIEVARDVVGISVDSHDRSFGPVDGDPHNPRTAWWEDEETWYKIPGNTNDARNEQCDYIEDPVTGELIRVDGAFVVGVPENTEKVAIRVKTLRNNDNDLQIVRIGATPWRQSDRGGTQENPVPTNDFTTDGMLELEIPKDVRFMEVPVYVNYNRRNESDPGVLYMLHIYRYSAQAYLVDLVGEEKYTSGDGTPTNVPTAPTFDQHSSRNVYDMTVESSVETIDFTDILPCDGATATVYLPHGLNEPVLDANGDPVLDENGKPKIHTDKTMIKPNELDAKADIHRADGSILTIEKEDLVRVTEDDQGNVTVVYKDAGGTEQTEIIPNSTAKTAVTYRNELHNVILEHGLNRMTIKVTSEDGTVTRTYVVTIRRKADPNAPKLRDIQMYNKNGEGRDVYYDFSPVFDPDNFNYYYAVPEIMEGDIVLNPVYYSDAKYGITVNTYADDQPVLSNVDLTGQSIRVPDLTAQSRYKVEITVYRTGEDSAKYGSNTYTIYFVKNDATERNVTATNLLTERTDYSPFADLKLDGAMLTRAASSDAHASDHNFYYNTTVGGGKLNVNVFAAVIKAGYQIYISNMASYDTVTGETEWKKVDLENGEELIFSENDNWFVLKATDGVNTFYGSVTVYRDQGGIHETHLTNLAVSDPTVPLFRDEIYDYFVAVDAESSTADLVARGHTGSDSYITEMRVRTVGGEYLLGGNGSHTRVEAYDIPLHQGTNRVTITVRHRIPATQLGMSDVSYKRAYEVELYLAGKTAHVVRVDEAGEKVTTEAANREEKLDTGDIIWMDYTAGGHITPIWNSELVNYFLSYDFYSDDYQRGADGQPVRYTQADVDAWREKTKQEPTFKAGDIKYLLNDHLELTATLRPEEVERATVTAQVTTIQPYTGTKTVFAPETLVRDAEGNWPFQLAQLQEGETQIVFTVKVKGVETLNERVDGEGNVIERFYTEGQVTERKYMITVYRSRSDNYEMPNVAKNTAIQVRDRYDRNKIYGTIPGFDSDINFYYVNLPYNVDAVNLYAQAGTYINSRGNQSQYVIKMNGHTVGSSDFSSVSLLNPYLAQDLMVGDNTIEVEISVPDFVTKHYTVILNRGDKESSTAVGAVTRPAPSMTGLRLTTHTPDTATTVTDLSLIPSFSTGTHYYNLVVPHEVSQIYAWGQAKDSGELRIASINVDDVRDISGTADKLAASIEGWREIPIPLSVGNENNIEFVAYGMDENGEVTDTMVRYIVNITRLPSGYLPPVMEFLGVSQGTLTSAFHGENYNYYVTVPYDVSSVNVEAMGGMDVSEVKLVGGDSNEVGRALYVTDSVKLDVGDNLLRIYLYDIRPVPEGGYPYYIGVYSLTIHRESKNGVIMELGDSAADTALKALEVIQTRGDGVTERVYTTVDFEPYQYGYYVYVQRQATAVEIRANALFAGNTVTINGVPAAGGSVTVELPADKAFVMVPIAVTDPATGTVKRYTLTVVRGNADSHTTPAGLPDYYPVGVITNDPADAAIGGITVLAGKGTAGDQRASMNTSTHPVTGEITTVSPKEVTLDMPTMTGTKAVTVKAVTVQVQAYYSKVVRTYQDDGKTPKVTSYTKVKVNGHTAQLITPNPKEGDLVTYAVTLPMTTYTDRFDIWVNYPTTHNGQYFDQNVCYVLYVTDQKGAPKAIELDAETGKPLRFTTQAEIDAWTAAHPGADVPQIGDFKYSDTQVSVGPQLDSISLDENDSTIHSGTFTTKFYGDVFTYRATAKGERFSVSASVVDKDGNTAQYAGRPAYIEVYDEQGNRYTISPADADYVHFTFPTVDREVNGETIKVRQIMTLTFRVIQYADSGYELVSEYKLTVYPTSEPLVDDLKLVQARMDGPKPFDTLVREYYGTVYKRQSGFAVYAEAEYFDQGDTLWRDGKLTMVARYPKLAPYDTTDDQGNAITILPGQEGYVTTYQRDAKGEIVYYEYQMKDQNGNSWGHLDFTGEFPQQTLPDSDENDGYLDMNYYGDGTKFLPWDVNDFDVVVTLTYPYGYHTYKGLNSTTDAKGHTLNPGDYVDEKGNWVADATVDMDAWREYPAGTPQRQAYEAASVYRKGSYVVHMTRSNVPILFTTLQNLTAYQPESEKRTLTQIGAILTGPDYNDILYQKDAEGNFILDEAGNKQPLPPGYQDEEKTILCDPNFDPAHPYYLLTLDYRMNTTWLSMKFDEDTQDVRLTSADVRQKFPESYYYENFKFDMESEKKVMLNFGEWYYADEDFKTLLQVTVTEKGTGNVARYMIWVVREDRHNSDSHIDLDLFYGITQPEANTAANTELEALRAELYQAQERADDPATTDVDEQGLWGTLYYDKAGDIQLYPGIVDRTEEIYQITEGGKTVVRVAKNRAEVPAGGEILTKVKGFEEGVFLYTTTLPMSAKYTTLDLRRIGNAQYANVVYNNRFYGDYREVDGVRSNIYDLELPDSQILLAEKGAEIKSVVDVPLKPGERISYIFVTAHADLNTAPAGSQLYHESATTYVIRIKRVNTVAFQNLWVTDTETTDSNANIPQHYEQMWLMRDTEVPKKEYETVRGYYDASGNLVAGKTDEDVAKLIDSKARHDIYDNDITHQYVDYGVMVSSLDTYIYLNAEAKGTRADGSNDGYHILIEEYGVENPQFVDSRTFQDGDGPGKITNAKFRLDPSKDGEQIFQFTIVDERTGEEGVYFLTVFRDHGDTELKVQTHVTGKVTTAAVRVPATQEDVDKGYAKNVGDYLNDFEATWTAYRKTDLLKYYKETEYKKDNLGAYVTDAAGKLQLLYGNQAPYPEKEATWYSVDEAIAALNLQVVVDGQTVSAATLDYDERFEALLQARDPATGRPYLVPTLTGKSDRYDGSYDIDFTDLDAGAYMIVFHRPGSLGIILDNVLVYPTWDVAMYNMGTRSLRAGDLNNNGVVGQDDLDLFNQYKTAMNGVYKELLGRVALASVTHTGSVTETYTVGDLMTLSELDGLSLFYKGVDVTSDQAIMGSGSFSSGVVTYYLSQNAYASSTAGMTNLTALAAAGTPYSFVDEGTYYLYGVFGFYDANLTARNPVPVVYRVAAITVSAPSVVSFGTTEETSAVTTPIPLPEVTEPAEETTEPTQPVADAPAEGEDTQVTELPAAELDQTDLAGEVTELTGEVIDLAGEAIELTGEVIDLAGEAIELTGELTELAPAQPEQVEEVTQLPEGAPMAGEEPIQTLPEETELPAETVEPLPEVDEIGELGDEVTELPAEIPETPAEDETPETPADAERPEIPEGLEPVDGGSKVELPDQPTETITETPVDTIDALVSYMVSNDIAVDSQTAQLLILEYILLTAETPFNYQVLDLTGDGFLNGVDESFIISHWGATLYVTARMDNMYHSYQAELEAYRP